MGVRLILGRSGTGKTHQCIEEITQMDGQPGNFALIYLVPEQFSLQSEMAMLNYTGKKAISRIQVLSFNRLAYHLFAESGVRTRNMLEDTGKAMLLRKIIYDIRDQLKYYEKPNISQGFIEKISAAITEFYEYNVSPETMGDNAAEDERLQLKIHDLGLIYTKYLEYLGEHYLSTDETLDLLADRIESSSYLTGAHIWLDAFSGFTPQEYKVLQNLIKKAASVHISLTVNSPKIKYPSVKQTDIFNETKETIQKINALAAQEGVKMEKALYLTEGRRFEKAPELKYLERAFFNPTAPPYEGKNRRVKTYAGANRYDEIEFIADYIISLVRDGGYRYSEIALITPGLDIYSGIIESVFSEYGIPAFIDKKTDILSHPLTELVRAAVEIPVKNWSYESVFRFLKCGMSPLTREESDLLENYCLAYGIKGYRWQQEQWLYGFGNGEFDKEEIHSIKEKAVNAMVLFAGGIDRRTKLTVRAYALRIYAMLDALGVTQRLAMLYDASRGAQDTVNMRQHSQVWGKMGGLFEQMVEILGNEELDIAGFSAILEAGLGSCDLGRIPPARDQLIVGDLMRSRLHEIKAIFIAGANEGVFPQPKGETGVFTDDERQLLSKNGMELAPDSAKRTFGDNFLVYTALTKAGGLLTLTYPSADINGKALYPAAAVSRVNTLFADAVITDRSPITISSPAPVFQRFSANLRRYADGGDMDDLSGALYRWFSGRKAYSPLLNRVEELLIQEDRPEMLNTKNAGDIYKKETRTSVSRIERYVQCPFSYFVEYNLNARERQHYQVRKLDLGNVFHYILEKFSEIIAAEGLAWDKLQYADIEKYTDLSFALLQQEMKSDIFLSDHRSQYILERTRKVAVKSIWALCRHIKRGSFMPYGAEVDFGLKSPVTGIVIEIDDHHRFVLTGRIDRIDVMSTAGKTYVKIIDYKSGSKKFDVTDIYYGMQLQLLLYMDTIIKNGGKMVKTDGGVAPGGILYFRIDDPILSSDRRVSEPELDELILSKFKMSGLVLKEHEVIRGMDNVFDKSSPVIPVTFDAKGGVSQSKSSVADTAEFSGAMDFAVNKVRDIGRQMVNGKIHPRPYKLGRETGCDYCSYKVICSFDISVSGKYRYHVLRKKNGLHDLLKQEKEGQED